MSAMPSGMPTPSPIASDLSTPPPDDASAEFEGVLVGDVSDAALLLALDGPLVESELLTAETGDEEGVSEEVELAVELAVELPPGRKRVLHKGTVVITSLDTLQHV